MIALHGWQIARQIGGNRRQIGQEHATCEKRKLLVGHRFGFGSVGVKPCHLRSLVKMGICSSTLSEIG